jgi:patatin-like phospholipase/acyl hydrolase
VSEARPTIPEPMVAPELERERFQILSLDGGGIRGLFSAAVLAAMEEDLGGRVVDRFDLIAGTSTGGIIAIGLGLGLRPSEIVDFYLRWGGRIFHDRSRLRMGLHWLARKYPARHLELALRETLGERLFGESEKRLVVVSYNLGDDDVYLFRTPHAERLRRDYRVPAWKVGDQLRLIDGGIWANNPAMVAVVEAVGTLHVPLESINVLSIGTYDAVTRRPSYLNRGGKLLWASKAAEVLLRATSIGVTNQVRFLVGPDRLLRVDPKVPECDTALDRPRDREALFTRARHHSRVFMPEIASKFSQHVAAPYTPLYVVTPSSE